MTDNAMWYLYSQLSDCCQEHYQWNYDECIGSSKKPYSALFYPDWETGINIGCKIGGGQPVVRCLEVIISMVIITLLTQSHLRPNHLVNSIWIVRLMFGCALHWRIVVFHIIMICWTIAWQLAAHQQVQLGHQDLDLDSTMLTGQMVHTCVETMVSYVCFHPRNCYFCLIQYTYSLLPRSLFSLSQRWWADIYDYFSWTLDACNPWWMLQTVVFVSSTHKKWYWCHSEIKCQLTLIMQSLKPNTLLYRWNYDPCMISVSSSNNPGIANPVTGTVPATSPASGKYYMNWSKMRCVRDCYGALPCGGNAEAWDETYDDLESCCKDRNWWDLDECLALEAWDNSFAQSLKSE